MSENRKTFRLTPEAQQVLDNTREAKRTYKGSRYDQKARKWVEEFRTPTENEVLNLIIDEFPRVSYLEKKLEEMTQFRDNIYDDFKALQERLDLIRDTLFPGIYKDFVRESENKFHSLEVELENLKTAIKQGPAPDHQVATSESDSKKRKPAGSGTKKKTAKDKDHE